MVDEMRSEVERARSRQRSSEIGRDGGRRKSVDNCWRCRVGEEQLRCRERSNVVGAKAASEGESESGGELRWQMLRRWDRF